MNSNSGKASREVVQGLINDMDTFSKYVTEELKRMLILADELGETWKDPQYNQFNQFITELVISLSKDLNIFDEATNALQKKLDMY